MTTPWLSVIVPTYNGAAYLDRALQSVAAQADDGVEIIAVDDGSTDETLAILQAYGARLRLRVEPRGRIGSWVKNTNHGLARARAAHACFLHQDDLWLPGRLHAVRAALTQARDAALVVHASRFNDARGRCVGRWRCPLARGRNEAARVIERLLVQNFIAIPAPVFSVRSALDAGGLDEQLWYTADWDLWLKLAGRGSTYYLPRSLTAFRVHDQSQTMQGAARAAEMRRQQEVVLRRHVAAARSNYAEVAAAADLSIQINHALADMAGGGRPDWWSLVRCFARSGWSGLGRYVRDSRIAERVAARLRGRMRSFTSPAFAGAGSA